jgi:hypothetical protein
MYWWNVSELAKELREGRVEEKDRFKYYLATWLLWTVGSSPFFFYGSTFKITDVIGVAITITVGSIGTILCYRRNRSGDNTDFIGRMICLTWPIGNRLLVLAAATGLAIFSMVTLTFKVGTAMGASVDQIEAALHVVRLVWKLALEILYYLLLYKYVTLVAQPKEAS